MKQNVIHGYFSQKQKKEKNEYYVCKSKIGDDIICTTIKSNNNIDDLKYNYPDIKYQGSIIEPICKVEIRGRFIIFSYYIF
jgi:hypothetical protein